ncbi:MAG: DUF6036 family nucleotidyltransferase [Chlamydiota bacterium]
MNMYAATLEQALETLGHLLLDRNYEYEVVAIGGGSLLLLGQILRMTKDLDLVALVDSEEFISAYPLPKNLLQAVNEVGLALDLGKDWLNAGPAALLEMGLPDGFKTRMQTRRYGGLTVHLAARFDQICFKLYASIDQGPESKHFADLKLLNPTEDELTKAANWCITHDVSEEFSVILQQVIMSLRGKNANS